MKLLSSKNTYTASNCKLVVSDDLTQVSAFSYSWWQFVVTDSVGNVFFNNSTYSNTTRKHQEDVSCVLSELGVKQCLVLQNTTENMTSDEGIREAIESEIQCIYGLIQGLEQAIAKRGSWKRTNAERAESIKAKGYEIKDLERIVKLVGKSLIPVAKPKIDHDVYLRSSMGRWAKWFQKPNGKIKDHDLARHCTDTHHDAPETISGVKELFGVKGNEPIDWLLGFKFIKDLDPMIPEVDSTEYTQLVRWAKRYDSHPRNALLLAKLHGYLINKQNRKDHIPKEPVEFPVHEVLTRIEATPKLRLIKTDQQLRAEGRTQSHCIGAKHYVEDCLSGYQALNFKGYTFLLEPDLRLAETHGRHNTTTPETIQSELMELISKAV